MLTDKMKFSPNNSLNSIAHWPPRTVIPKHGRPQTFSREGQNFLGKGGRGGGKAHKGASAGARGATNSCNSLICISNKPARGAVSLMLS